MPPEPVLSASALRLLAHPAPGPEELLRLCLQDLLVQDYYQLEDVEARHGGKVETVTLLRRGVDQRPQSAPLGLVIDVISRFGERPLPMVVVWLLNRPKFLRALKARSIEELVQQGLATTSRRPFGVKKTTPTETGLRLISQHTPTPDGQQQGLDLRLVQGMQAAAARTPVDASSDGSPGGPDPSLTSWIGTFNTCFDQGAASHHASHDGAGGGWSGGDDGGSGHSGGHDGGGGHGGH